MTSQIVTLLEYDVDFTGRPILRGSQIRLKCNVWSSLSRSCDDEVEADLGQMSLKVCKSVDLTYDIYEERRDDSGKTMTLE